MKLVDGWNTAIWKYHECNRWKLWPRIEYTRCNSVRILEFLFGRYGFQVRWWID